jgi:hypothetical protein
VIQKLQIAKKKSIPKIISRILATVAVLVISWLYIRPFWFWTGFELLAGAAVAIGCAGEWYFHHHPAGKKKREKDEHHKVESRFIALVVVGVFMELVSLGHTIKEGVVFEKKVAEANVRAGEANKLAGEANERAALANERAASNELQVVQLKAEMQRRSEAWQLPEYLRIQNQYGRVLQAQVFITPLPQCSVIFDSGSSGEVMAMQLVKLAEGIGFPVHVPSLQQIMEDRYAFWHDVPTNGVSIAYRGVPHPAIQTLMYLLRANNQDFHVITNRNGIPNNQFFIFVGVRPPN